jgi:hypothetical protein
MYRQPVYRRARLLVGLLCTCALFACSPSQNDSKASTGATPAPAPTMYRPKGLDSQSSMKGVYADRWTGPKASFIVSVPRTARSIKIDIGVPDHYYKRGEQGIAVKVGNGASQPKHGLPIGRQTLSFALVPASRGKNVNVSLVTDATFVPANVGVNDDPRQLGVIFYGVSFE